MKFVYISDTHMGCREGVGYQMQCRYGGSYTQELFGVLADWVRQEGGVDFIVHGGDAVDEATPENLGLAKTLFALMPCPVYLSLGNHDLTAIGAREKWLEAAPELFPNGKTEASFVWGGVRFDLLTSHWGRRPYFWDPAEPQIPWFSEEQLDVLCSEPLSTPRVIISHAPPCGVPPEQTGLEKPIHCPDGNFGQVVETLCAKYTPVLWLGAHNHMNLLSTVGGTHRVTVSALTEVPFEFKLFEIGAEPVSMKTVSLRDRISFPVRYDFAKRYVQGREIDREF